MLGVGDLGSGFGTYALALAVLVHQLAELGGSLNLEENFVIVLEMS